jgi:hypothetical protein
MSSTVAPNRTSSCLARSVKMLRARIRLMSLLNGSAAFTIVSSCPSALRTWVTRGRAGSVSDKFGCRRARLWGDRVSADDTPAARISFP